MPLDKGRLPCSVHHRAWARNPLNRGLERGYGSPRSHLAEGHKNNGAVMKGQGFRAHIWLVLLADRGSRRGAHQGSYRGQMARREIQKQIGRCTHVCKHVYIYCKHFYIYICIYIFAVYIYICTCVQIYIYICTCIDVFIYIYICINIAVCVGGACMCICVYVYMCVCVCGVCVCVCTCFWYATSHVSRQHPRKIREDHEAPAAGVTTVH